MRGCLRYTSHVKSMPACPRCGEAHVRRTSRENVLERLFSLFYLYPFRCQLCGHRFRAVQWGQRYVRRQGDRREFERHPARFPVTFGLGSEQHEGVVRQISIDGCTVETTVPLTPGSALSLTMRPDGGEPISVTHCLVRTVAPDRLGIQFVQLSVEEHDALRRLVWRVITALAASPLPPSSPNPV